MSELANAYALLAAFKSGNLEPRRELSTNELALIRLLAKDLLPTRIVPDPLDDSDFGELIVEIVKQDSKWNHALMEALDLYYNRIRANDSQSAARGLREFIGECNSEWYRKHAESAME